MSAIRSSEARQHEHAGFVGERMHDGGIVAQYRGDHHEGAEQKYEQSAEEKAKPVFRVRIYNR